MGEAFEKAPKGDVKKLTKVEYTKAPIEPLETEELVQKFTRPKDDKYYSNLSYVSPRCFMGRCSMFALKCVDEHIQFSFSSKRNSEESIKVNLYRKE